MHLKRVTFFPEKYPTKDHYPFNLRTFHQTRTISFDSPITFFVGENGTGKSTLLKALAKKCQIHMWRGIPRITVDVNPFEEALHFFIGVQWTDGRVPGAFFSSETFRDFSAYLDEWAAADPELLSYFGGKSLITLSHGQSLMSYFKGRYRIRGLYLLDEPETALSPRSQLELLQVLKETGRSGHAQFVIATHSPILLACPGSKILSFDHIPVQEVDYRDTEHYRIYKDFMENTDRYL